MFQGLLSLIAVRHFYQMAEIPIQIRRRVSAFSRQDSLTPSASVVYKESGSHSLFLGVTYVRA